VQVCEFDTGDVLFVAAGVEHRFENFSDDLVPCPTNSYHFSVTTSVQPLGAPRRNSRRYCDEVQQRGWALVGAPAGSSTLTPMRRCRSCQGHAIAGERRLALTPVLGSETVRISRTGH
jgi:hypothetical protein